MKSGIKKGINICTRPVSFGDNLWFPSSVASIFQLNWSNSLRFSVVSLFCWVIFMSHNISRLMAAVEPDVDKIS